MAQVTGEDEPAALANMQAATLREDCRPENKPSREARGEELLEQPSRVWSGEGSHGRGMSHQKNPVSQRDRGRSMHEQYGKEKKGR